MNNKEIINVRSELSFSEILNNDQNNIANHYNTHRFKQILDGNINSPALSYLMNMGHMHISDYKTLDYFNNKYIAIKERTLEELNEENSKKTIHLKTKIKTPKININKLLNHRKSTRHFLHLNISFNKFSYILSALCNNNNKKYYKNIGQVYSKNYASGGGLYPVNTYILVLNVDNICSGWYRLQPYSHSIKLINSDVNNIEDIISGKNIDIKNASFIIFYSFNIEKSYPKYGESSLELALKEIGEMAQLIDIETLIYSLGGHLTGIWDQNTFFIGNPPFPIPQINYITATLTNVSPLVYENNLHILYHLSGYGSNYQESKISFLGESSERYAFSLMPTTLKNDIVFTSYKSLTEHCGVDSVLPLKYINVFSDDYPTENLNENDKIHWVKMNSILNPNNVIYIPTQLVMFQNFQNNEDKRINISAVSTGTASHETITRALENSLIECFQIDSYNLWWYGGHEGIKLNINLDSIFEEYFDHFPNEFKEHFEIKFTDISFDKSIYVIVCEIFGIKENLPKYTVGLQGAFSLNRAIYRSLMEALTEMAYTINMSWMKPNLLKEFLNKSINMDNLDKNIAHYTMNDKPIMAKNKVNLNNDTTKANNLSELIKLNEDILKWAGFINITPHEFDNLNLNITRVITPKLLPVCMPSYPPLKHPRYKATGGLINNVPHPMA